MFMGPTVENEARTGSNFACTCGKVDSSKKIPLTNNRRVCLVVRTLRPVAGKKKKGDALFFRIPRFTGVPAELLTNTVRETTNQNQRSAFT